MVFYSKDSTVFSDDSEKVFGYVAYPRLEDKSKAKILVKQ